MALSTIALKWNNFSRWHLSWTRLKADIPNFPGKIFWKETRISSRLTSHISKRLKHLSLPIINLISFQYLPKDEEINKCIESTWNTFCIGSDGTACLVFVLFTFRLKRIIIFFISSIYNWCLNWWLIMTKRKSYKKA